MEPQLIHGRIAELPSGASVGLYPINGGYAAEFSRVIDGVDTDIDLLGRSTCKAVVEEGRVVTSISLSAEAIAALWVMMNELMEDESKKGGE